MKLEDQVCSQDLSIKLKKVDVRQDSLYYWTNLDDDEGITPVYGRDAMLLVELYNIPNTLHTGYLHNNLKHGRNLIFTESAQESRTDWASAFTVAELAQLLPEDIGIIKTKEYYWIYQLTDEDGDNIWYQQNPDYDPHEEREINLANGIAKMLIYLIENKLMEPPK